MGCAAGRALETVFVHTYRTAEKASDDAINRAARELLI